MNQLLMPAPGGNVHVLLVAEHALAPPVGATAVGAAAEGDDRVGETTGAALVVVGALL